MYCFDLMCWVCNEFWTWYVQVDIPNILQLDYIQPWPQKHWIVFHQFSVGVP